MNPVWALHPFWSRRFFVRSGTLQTVVSLCSLLSRMPAQHSSLPTGDMYLKWVKSFFPEHPGNCSTLPKSRKLTLGKKSNPLKVPDPENEKFQKADYL